MGSNLKIMGNTFSNVSSITAHDATSGTHKYIDTSSTTATAADVRSGEKFYNANGVETQGSIEEYNPIEIFDLTNTTWYLNDYDQLDFSTDISSLIRFISNGILFKQLTVSATYSEMEYFSGNISETNYMGSGSGSSSDYHRNSIFFEFGWTGKYAPFRTVKFLNNGSAKITLYNWLKANATLISAEGTVFNGVQINHFDGSTIALPTKDKISVENIQIYNKKPEVEELDVNFFDYDGTILYSYGYQEFADLTAFPTCSCDTSFNPTYNTAEWNWTTLAAAKTYVASNKKLQIGKQYINSSSMTTRQCLKMKIKLEEEFVNPTLAFGLNGTVLVSWGDGTSADIITGTDVDTIVSKSHTYSYAGEFWITIAIDNNNYMKILGDTHSLLLSQNRNVTTKVNRGFYQNCIKEVWVGNNCYLGGYAFAFCGNLEKVVLAYDTTCMTTIPYRAFYVCGNLKTVVIPKSVTSIEWGAFDQCIVLNRISLPNTITTLDNGAFENIISGGLKLTLPNTITAIPDSLCSYDWNNTEVIIPEGVTTIGANAFNSNYLIRKITIPSTITSIDSKAFANMIGLQEIRFNSITPPTILNSDAFDGLQTNAKIYFPVAIDSNNYITNYSDYAYGTNYPGGYGTDRFIGYATINSNTNVPTMENWTAPATCQWKKTKKEAVTQSGTTLTKGNGSEIYCYIWDGWL